MTSELSPFPGIIPTVNFHLIKPCNMKCGFCFATFQDLPPKLSDCLPQASAIELVTLIAAHGASKINFAGGEPTLYPNLVELVRCAKAGGVKTSVVTNGSKVGNAWLDEVAGYLDILAISIDSVDPDTLRKIGRVENGKPPMSDTDYLQIGEGARARDIRLKVNTVVNRYNVHEDMSRFIMAMNPERWKIFQALPVIDQNDMRIEEFKVTPAEFDGYVSRNRLVESQGIKVVPENNEAMTGSYLMIDPLGRFYDNSLGKHTYSDPILTVGVERALRQIQVYPDRFLERGGLYE